MYRNRYFVAQKSSMEAPFLLWCVLILCDGGLALNSDGPLQPAGREKIVQSAASQVRMLLPTTG